MNVAKKFSGHSEAILTENGRDQAKRAGSHVRNQQRQIDYIVCSPLQRARETARLIAKEIDFPTTSIEYNELFMERNFAPLEGTDTAEYIGSGENYRKLDSIAGVETIEALQKRAELALAYAKSLPADNVLIVSHGAFGRAFRRVVQNEPHTHEYDAIKWIGNCEIIELI